MANQWEAEPFGKLEIPPERKASQQFRWTAPAPVNLSGTCAEWVQIQHGVTLKDVLIDTSQRFQGSVITQRVTHRRELTIVNAPILVFLLNENGS